MAKMYPKQAVELTRQFLKECTEDSASTLFGILSPKHAQAIKYLADFVDEVRQARDVAWTINRLFEDGIICEAPGKGKSNKQSHKRKVKHAK